MKLFDGYLAVDWSANGKPKQGKDSIWIAIQGVAETEELDNPATRQEAMGRIECLLEQATAAGRRLLVGFDFPFGYPAGTARMLAGRDGWETVWSRVAEVIEDGPRNANNRFDAAASLNAAFEGEGPFWGNGLQRDIPRPPKEEASGRLGREPTYQPAPRRVRGKGGAGGLETQRRRVGRGSGADPESRRWRGYATVPACTCGRSKHSARGGPTCWRKSIRR